MLKSPIRGFLPLIYATILLRIMRHEGPQLTDGLPRANHAQEPCTAPSHVRSQARIWSQTIFPVDAEPSQMLYLFNSTERNIATD
jgi:hypothetical protein